MFELPDNIAELSMDELEALSAKLDELLAAKGEELSLDELQTLSADTDAISSAIKALETKTQAEAPIKLSSRDKALDVDTSNSNSSTGLSVLGTDGDTIAELAASMVKGSSKMAQGSRQTFGTIASPSVVQLSANGEENAAILAAAPKAPKGQSLVAAGWCGPTTVIESYDSVGSVDYGRLVLPSVSGPSGKIEIPSLITAADTVGQGFTWTETNANTPGDEKACNAIGCPTWVPCTSEARGVCLTIDNMTAMGSPVWVQKQIEQSLIRKARLETADAINAIDAAANTIVVDVNVQAGGGAADLLATVEFLAQRESDINSEDNLIQVLLPTWAKAVVRSDLSRRGGIDLINVSDQMIASWFAARGAAVQFVSMPGSELTVASLGYPASIPVYAFLDGAVMHVDAGDIEFDMIRDSALSKINAYSFFTESFYCNVVRGQVTRADVVTCQSGQVGAADISC